MGNTPRMIVNLRQRQTSGYREGSNKTGARCSSVVRVFAHGAMGRRIDPSWWTHGAISRSRQCSKTGIPNAVICAILSVG